MKKFLKKFDGLVEELDQQSVRPLSRYSTFELRR
jgi:hypothetical protein